MSAETTTHIEFDEFERQFLAAYPLNLVPTEISPDEFHEILQQASDTYAPRVGNNILINNIPLMITIMTLYLTVIISTIAPLVPMQWMRVFVITENIAFWLSLTCMLAIFAVLKIRSYPRAALAMQALNEYLEKRNTLLWDKGVYFQLCPVCSRPVIIIQVQQAKKFAVHTRGVQLTYDIREDTFQKECPEFLKQSGVDSQDYEETIQQVSQALSKKRDVTAWQAVTIISSILILTLATMLIVGVPAIAYTYTRASPAWMFFFACNFVNTAFVSILVFWFWITKLRYTLQMIRSTTYTRALKMLNVYNSRYLRKNVQFNLSKKMYPSESIDELLVVRTFDVQSAGIY
jgi:hypothetical protein